MGQGLPSLYNDRLSTLGDLSTRIDDQHAMSDDSDDDQKEKKSKKVKKDKPDKKDKKKKNADEVPPVKEAGLCFALSLHSPFVLVCVRRSRSQKRPRIGEEGHHATVAATTLLQLKHGQFHQECGPCHVIASSLPVLLSIGCMITWTTCGRSLKK